MYQSFIPADVSDTPQIYGAVLAILQLIYTSGFDIKLEASRQLLSILCTKTSAAKNFAKQLGWQEVLAHLFVLRPSGKLESNDLEEQEGDITMETDQGAENSNLIDFGNSDSESRGDNLIDFCEKNESETKDLNECLEMKEKCTSAVTEDVTDNATIAKSVQADNCDIVSEDKCDISIAQLTCDTSAKCDIPSGRKKTPPFSLNLNVNCVSEEQNISDDMFNLSETPSTPLYTKMGYFDTSLSEYDDDFRPVSRSSSASAEDLSSIGQRVSQRHQLEKEESCTSLSQISEITPSESDLSLADVEMRPKSMSKSVSQSLMSPAERETESKERMYDSLGLRGSFLMNFVGNSEELCQNLLIVVYTIMWKGLEGSDAKTWKVPWSCCVL